MLVFSLVGFIASGYFLQNPNSDDEKIPLKLVLSVILCIVALIGAMIGTVVKGV